MSEDAAFTWTTISYALLVWMVTWGPFNGMQPPPW